MCLALVLEIFVLIRVATGKFPVEREKVKLTSTVRFEPFHAS